GPDAKIGASEVFDRFPYTDAKGVVDTVGAFDGPLFDAIIQATNDGYPLINMTRGGSLRRNDKGSNASWLAWNRVANYANRNGTLIVASAGNDGYDLNGVIAHVPSDLPTVLSTSATGMSQLAFTAGLYQPTPGAADVLAFYSNYGSPVDIAAPGGDCGPGYPNSCDAPYLILNDYVFPDGTAGYVFAAGTSMATPHVSATAAY